MADFKKAQALTSEIEGGYANDPDDLGGETYRGVARKSWPNWPGWSIIDKVKAETPKELLSNKYLTARLSQDAGLQIMVESFYKTNFWDKARLDEIESQDIANEVYDSGVNFGPGKVVRWLQEAYNLSTTGADIAVDGLVGSKPVSQTISAVNAHPDVKLLYKTLNVIQGAAYIEAIRNKASQGKYFRGWFKRVTFLPA